MKENEIFEKLNAIETLLMAMAQNKRIKYAYINESSSELWNAFDISDFMQIWLAEFMQKVSVSPTFPKPVIQTDNVLSTKWRSGSVVTWIKKQEQ